MQCTSLQRAEGSKPWDPLRRMVGFHSLLPQGLAGCEAGVLLLFDWDFLVVGPGHSCCWAGLSQNPNSGHGLKSSNFLMVSEKSKRRESKEVQITDTAMRKKPKFPPMLELAWLRGGASNSPRGLLCISC